MIDELRQRQPVAYEALRILKYAYRLGALRGPLTWVRFKLARKPVAVSLPQVAHRILVRPGTSDVWTFEKIFVSLEYDLSFLDLQPKVIVDVGANVGYASVYFAQRFPAARIVAVEPQVANFEQLKKNTHAYANVTPVFGALWPRSASLAIENPDDDAWAFRVREAAPSAAGSVRGISMLELLADHGLSSIDILKIDIEGAEKDLFQTDADVWLDKVKVLVIELHDWMRDGCATAFYRATSKLDFRHYVSGENTILVRVE